jgi:APA family basic amino acid/polyamine antiporter
MLAVLALSLPTASADTFPAGAVIDQAAIVDITPEGFESIAQLIPALLPSSLPLGVDFVVPFCPWVPLAAMAINVYLLASLAPLTWARFGVWLLLGSGIYFVSAHARRASHMQTDSLTPPLPPLTSPPLPPLPSRPRSARA